MTASELPEYHSGTGKVVRPGDTVRIDGRGARYRVQKITSNGGGVEVHCYGGPANRERYRVVVVDADQETLMLDSPGRGCIDVTDQLPYGDYSPGRWGWLLEDIQPVDPVPVAGRQGLWEWAA